MRREESRKPLANGLLSILSFVICNRRKNGRWLIHGGQEIGDRRSDRPRTRINIGDLSQIPRSYYPARDSSASLRENYVTGRPTARGGKWPAVSKRFVPSIGSQRLVKLEEGGEATYLYGGEGDRGIGGRRDRETSLMHGNPRGRYESVPGMHRCRDFSGK